MEGGGAWKRTWEGQGEEKKAWKRTKLQVHTKCKRAMGEMEDGRREIGGEKRGTLNGGGQGESESERGRERESRVGVVASPLDCY